MEKRHLLPPCAQHKANLHCHTTCSDGRLTPEQTKEVYMRHGYDVVAFTDHEYIVNHQDLTDDHFIALTGYEIAIGELPHDGYTNWLDLKCCHMNLYARDPNEEHHVCFHPKAVWGPGAAVADKLKYKGGLYYKDYNKLQEVIDIANANGYIVCFNHAYWSLQPHSDYFGLTGLFGMEVYNTGCDVYSGETWTDYGLFCEFNQDVAPVAADDNHNGVGNGYEGVEHSDCFGGFTMILTDDFSYSGIFAAMERKDVYASTGILFKEISVTGNTVHVECSECTHIVVSFGGRRWKQAKDFSGLTFADFDIPDGARFIRVYCDDKRTGHRAASKPYMIH